jgi:glycosyltransferase involved in cell wall biosynthesis
MTHTVFYFTDTTGFGGAEQALLTLIAGLNRQYWQPVLIHHPDPGLAPLLTGARQLGVPLWAVPRMPEGKQGAVRVPQFVRELWRKRPTVFHAHLTWPRACKYGLIAAMLARVPAIVVTEQLFVKVPWNRLAYLQQRLIAAGVDRYIAVSREVARRLRQTYQIPGRKIQVIHNAVSVASFTRPDHAALRLQWLGTTNRPVILTPARLDKQKGHSYLLEAATQVPDALFVLAGDGAERRALETQTRALGLEQRVIFLGYRQDIPDLLASCDLFVLPSLFEGLPLSVLEAMAAGKPVIASAIGGTDEAVVHGETGLLVPPGDSTALAAAVRTLLADPALAQRLAAAGKARVQQEFSAETMVQRVTQVYDELLARREVPHGRR